MSPSDLPPLIPMFAMAVAVIFGLPFGLYAMYLEHRRRAMWHEMVRLALEKGQPLPAAAPGEDPMPRGRSKPDRDVRAGLILVGIGIGLAIFFRTIGAREVMGVGAIPGCIGAALVLSGLFLRSKSSPEIPPPRT